MVIKGEEFEPSSLDKNILIQKLLLGDFFVHTSQVDFALIYLSFSMCKFQIAVIKKLDSNVSHSFNK